jgi:hypothetical protein
MLKFAMLLLLLLAQAGWTQPVFLPNGAEGIDEKSYDVKNRAPVVTITQGLATIQVPLLKPEQLPRTLQRAEFRSVGMTTLNVKLGEETRGFYCPSRLVQALKMEEWLSGTPIVIGVYGGFEGKPAVVSLMPEILDGKAPYGWKALNEQTYRSPLGDSFVCILPAIQERVLFAGQPGQANIEAGLTVYQQAGSDWRVACSRRDDALRVLVSPAQDFSLLFESLSSYFF